MNLPQQQEWQEIEQFLASRRAMSLATISATHEPASAPVYFNPKSATELDFVSKYDSLHICNLEFQPLVAAAIYQEGTQLSEICGLQVKGHVRQVEPLKESEARELYMIRYPEVLSNGYLRQMFMQTPLFRLTLTWIRYCDFRNGAIRRREWTLS